jgi:hypothetical protein
LAQEHSAFGSVSRVSSVNESGDEAYSAADEAMVREATAIARQAQPPRRLVAAVVWEGSAREGSDTTRGFLELAAEAGFDTQLVTTI